MTGYQDLGVRPVINAAATLTRLGGSRMPPAVVEAMRMGAQSFVDMLELQRRVGERIAQLTNNEACYVSSGAAAGMAISIAGCIAGSDAELVHRLPQSDGLPPEVIVHRAHRTGYDQAARQTGARLVEVGQLSGSHVADLEAAFSAQTVCVLYFAGAHYAEGALPLEVVVATAHAHGVPVLVDAAAQIPPLDNLWRFTREAGRRRGDLLGRQRLARAAVERPGARSARADRGVHPQRPAQPQSRAAHESRQRGDAGHPGGRRMVARTGRSGHAGQLRGDRPVLARGLADLPGVHVERGFPSEAGQPHARAIVHLGPASRLNRAALIAALWDASPRIAVGEVGADAIALNPQTLDAAEADVVLDALVGLLGS